MKRHLLHPWLPAHSKERKTINWRALKTEKQFHELWYWFLRRELFLKSYCSFYRKEVKKFLFNKDTKINFKYNLSSLFGLKKKKANKRQDNRWEGGERKSHESYNYVSTAKTANDLGEMTGTGLCSYWEAGAIKEMYTRQPRAERLCLWG